MEYIYDESSPILRLESKSVLHSLLIYLILFFTDCEIDSVVLFYDSEPVPPVDWLWFSPCTKVSFIFFDLGYDFLIS